LQEVFSSLTRYLDIQAAFPIDTYLWTKLKFVICLHEIFASNMLPLKTTLTSRLQSLLSAHSVTGASLALIRHGVMEIATSGVKDAATGDPVNTQTVFDAASLSKPVVAWAALQLADAGVLDLDEPVCLYARRIVPEDAASALITARHLLSHTAGLQNLRTKNEPLRVYFQPGARASYSSIGFMYLQAAVEALTDEPLEATMQRLVFEPLGMGSSSFEWQEKFSLNTARPHESGKPLDKHLPQVGNASYSLQTTAGDYCAFVAAVLKGDRLNASTWKEWFTVRGRVPKGAAVYLERTPPDTEPDVGWGLGWGVEPTSGTFFQWGKMDGVRAFVMGSLVEQAGFVLLTNSNTGLRLVKDLTQDVLRGQHAAVDWLKCVTE
jgi:CubicO group peptidase (beta-lactamase class C family)